MPKVSKPKYSDHRSKWSDCKLCSLHHSRCKIVLDRIRPSPSGRLQVPCDVLFVGEAPGPSEDATGKAFIGPAGNLLDQIIEKALPPLTRVAFTNLVACMPKIDGEKGWAIPSKEAIDSCRPRLLSYLRTVRPYAIIRVGELSKKHLLDKELLGLGRIKAVADIVHPSFILRNRANAALFESAIQRCIVTIRDIWEEVIPF